MTTLAGWAFSDAGAFARASAGENLNILLQTGDDTFSVSLQFETGEPVVSVRRSKNPNEGSEWDLIVRCPDPDPQYLATGAAWWALALRHMPSCKDTTQFHPFVQSGDGSTIPFLKIPQDLTNARYDSRATWFAHALECPLPSNPVLLQVFAQLPWTGGRFPLVEKMLTREQLSAWKGNMAIVVRLDSSGCGELTILPPKSLQQIVFPINAHLHIKGHEVPEPVTVAQLDAAFVNYPAFFAPCWRSRRGVEATKVLLTPLEQLECRKQSTIVIPILRFGSVRKLGLKTVGATIHQANTIARKHLYPVGPIELVELLPREDWSEIRWEIRPRRRKTNAITTTEAEIVSGTIKYVKPGFGLQASLHFPSAEVVFPLPIAVSPPKYGPGRILAPAGVHVHDEQLFISGQSLGVLTLSNAGPCGLRLELPPQHSFHLLDSCPRYLKQNETWTTQVLRRTNISPGSSNYFANMSLVLRIAPVNTALECVGPTNEFSVTSVLPDGPPPGMVVSAFDVPPEIDLRTGQGPGTWGIPVLTNHHRALSCEILDPAGRSTPATLSPSSCNESGLFPAQIRPLCSPIDQIRNFGGDMAAFCVRFKVRDNDFHVDVESLIHLTGIICAQRKFRCVLRAHVATCFLVDLLANGVQLEALAVRCVTKNGAISLHGELLEVPPQPRIEEASVQSMIGDGVLLANRERIVRRWLCLRPVDVQGSESMEDSVVVTIVGPRGEAYDHIECACVLKPWVPVCQLIPVKATKASGGPQANYHLRITNTNPHCSLELLEVRTNLRPIGRLKNLAECGLCLEYSKLWGPRLW